MKIGLIFPRFKYPTGDPPLGLAYIAASLSKNTKADIKFIDTTFYTDKNEIKQELENEFFDIVGISVMTTMLNDALWIASYIKSVSPNTKIFFGGPHPTVLPDISINYENVDGIVIGEGEVTFSEIVNNNGDPTNIAGCWFKKNKEIIRNPLRKPMSNLDDLEYPARHLLNMNEYIFNWFQMDSISAGLRGTNISATRGCPYRCSYCQPTLNSLFGKKLRKRNPIETVRELIFLKKKYKIQSFIFVDDTLNIDRKWLHEFCRELIKSNLNLLWGCNIRANLARHDDLSLMKESGLRKIFFGIESLNPRILDEIYQKDITLTQVENTIDIAKQLDLKIQGYFMLGAPTETRKDLLNTINNARKFDIDDATFSITTPLPGTFLYDKTQQYIDKSLGDFDYYKSYVYNDEFGFNQKTLNIYKFAAFCCFYLTPKRLFNTFKMVASLDGIRKTLMKLKRI